MLLPNDMVGWGLGMKFGGGRAGNMGVEVRTTGSHGVEAIYAGWWVGE